MRVRTATLADLHDLGAFFLEAWREAGPESPGFTGATEETMRDLASEESLSAQIMDPLVRVFMAEEGNQISGFAALRRIDSAAVELSGMMVLQKRVRRGVGTELFKKAQEFSISEGYRKMEVKTEAFNRRAIAFYKKLGFVQSGETEDNLGGTLVKLMVLQKSLP